MSNYQRKLQDFMKKRRDKLMKRPIGVVTLHVVGSGAVGDPKSLYLFTDHDRYLFNCGEGTQRLCSSHHFKLGRVSDAFITRPTWGNVGGLPGVAMALRDQGAVELKLHGPPELVHLLSSCQSFVMLQGLRTPVQHCVANATYEDRAIRVTYAPLVGDMAGQAEARLHHQEEKDDSDGDDECRVPMSMCYAVRVVAAARRGVLLPGPCAERGVPFKADYRDKLKSGQDVTLPDGTLVNCVSKQVRCAEVTAPAGSRRVVSPQLCAARGVPAGPLLRKLKDGCVVTLPGGEEVRPEEVTVVPQKPPEPLFLVVDVPSDRFIDSLLRNDVLRQNANDVCVIVHFTPKSVMNDPRYAGWMQLFPAAVHLALGAAAGARVSGGVRAATQQLQHHLLLPQVFPQLQSSGVPDRSANEVEQAFGGNPVTVIASALLQYHLLPHTGLDRSSGPSLDSRRILNELVTRPSVGEALDRLRRRLRNVSTPINLRSEFPRLTFLGTGGAVPSALRNTACIILELSPERSLLLDCAEGSSGQLLRLLGAPGARHLLGSLRAVFLSHSHADHVLGLPGLLRERRRLLPLPLPPLLVIAPGDIVSFLRRVDSTFQLLLDEGVSFIASSDLEYHGSSAENRLREALEATEVRTAPVVHGRAGNAYALAVRARDWKVTYSGDTAPCHPLTELGAGSTVLIHEATLEDALQGLARAKRHSTPSDAKEAAHRMKASFTILTHFSQRYARVPRLDQLDDTEAIGVAFDNMQVRPCDLPLLPLLLQPLQAMYNQSISRLRQKANRLRRPRWG